MRRSRVEWKERLALGAALLTVLTATALVWRSIDRSLPLLVEATPRPAPLRGSADALPDEVLANLPWPAELRVERGSSLFGTFQDAGLDPAAAARASEAVAEYLDPRSLQAGTRWYVYAGSDGGVRRMVMPIDRRGEIVLEPGATDGAWASRFREYRIERRRAAVTGVLEEGGLESAMRAAGAPAAVAYALADVFQWDIDFTRDLRLGDVFSVVYDARFVEGRLEGVDTIWAATYENRGDLREAYRFGEEGGYYDGEGRPLKKQFLRSPLPYSRVTSRFSKRRFHPVLKVYRPHYGVDYGAPTGTPVRSTAAGSVVFAGRAKGAGNMVTVRHPNGYETSYLHLSRFATRKGRRVRQGEVVGYVGATGLATAAHLDYRVKKHGRYMNPLALKNEPAAPLAEHRRVEFEIARDRLRLELGGAPLSGDGPEGVRLARTARQSPAADRGSVATAARAASARR